MVAHFHDCPASVQLLTRLARSNNRDLFSVLLTLSPFRSTNTSIASSLSSPSRHQGRHRHNSSFVIGWLATMELSLAQTHKTSLWADGLGSVVSVASAVTAAAAAVSATDDGNDDDDDSQWQHTSPSQSSDATAACRSVLVAILDLFASPSSSPLHGREGGGGGGDGRHDPLAYTDLLPTLMSLSLSSPAAAAAALAESVCLVTLVFLFCRRLLNTVVIATLATVSASASPASRHITTASDMRDKVTGRGRGEIFILITPIPYSLPLSLPHCLTVCLPACLLSRCISHCICVSRTWWSKWCCMCWGRRSLCCSPTTLTENS